MRDIVKDLLDNLLDEFIDRSNNILNIEKGHTLKNSKDDGTNNLLDFMTREELMDYCMNKVEDHIDELEQEEENMENECIEPITISEIEAGISSYTIDKLGNESITVPEVITEGHGDVWIECNACNNPIVSLRELLNDLDESVDISYGDSLSEEAVLKRLGLK